MSRPPEENIIPPAVDPFAKDRFSPIPPNGQRCQYTGLSHGFLYRLLAGEARGHVRVAHLKARGATRGKTLYSVSDLLAYLNGLAETRAKGNRSPAAEVA
jgi:hypothetical protein